MRWVVKRRVQRVKLPYPHCMVLLTETGGRQIAELSLLPNAVVEDFNIFCDLAFRLLASDKTAMMHEFGFQQSPTTFRRRVMARGQASRSQQLPSRLIDARMPN